METISAPVAIKPAVQLPSSYQAIADEIINQLNAEAAGALQELSVNVNGESASPSPTGRLFHAAFKDAFKGNLQKATRIALVAKPFLRTVPTPAAARPSTTLVPVPKQVATALTEPPLHISLRDNNPKATLQIYNNSIQCVTETDGFLGGKDEMDIALVIIDPLGRTQKSGPYSIGNYGKGSVHADNWLFASVDLAAVVDAHWPRTYTVVWSLAEIDGGGFAQYVDELLDKIQGLVTSKLTQVITTAIVGIVGEAVADSIAVAIGVTIGGSAGSIVPLIGTAIGAAVGAILGFVVSKVFGLVKSWVDDDIFPPQTIQLSIAAPGDNLGGNGASNAVLPCYGQGGHYVVNYGCSVDWGISLGESSPSPYHFSDPNAQQVAYLDASGNIDVLWVKNGAWVYTAASAQANAPAAVSDPCAYIDADGINQHIVYTTADFKVCELFSTPQGWAVNPNIATGMPGIGRPSGYFWQNTHSVAYTGIDQQIYVAWVQGGKWVSRSPGADAGTPKSISSPYAIISNEGTAQNIYYIGTDHHIYQLWCFTGGGWNHTDVTAQTGAPLPTGNIQAYVPAGNTVHQHVCYRATGTNDIWLCWFDGSTWFSTNLTATANAVKAAGSPFGICSPATATKAPPIRPPKGEEHETSNILYRGADGHIYQLWGSGSKWSVSTPTISTGLPTAIGNPSVYFTGNNMMSIVYLGINHNYYQIWWDPAGKWGWLNLTVSAKSPAPMS